MNPPEKKPTSAILWTGPELIAGIRSDIAKLEAEGPRADPDDEARRLKMLAMLRDDLENFTGGSKPR